MRHPKVSLVLLLLFCAGLPLWAQNSSVLGRIYGLNGATKRIYLFAIEGKNVYPRDSATLAADGSFAFKGAYLDGMYKLGFNQKQSNEFVLAGGEQVSLFANAGDLGKDNGLTAKSLQNEMYQAMERTIDRFSYAMDSVNNVYKFILTTDPYYNRKQEERSTKMRQLTQTMINAQLDIIKARAPKSYAGEILSELYRFPDRVGTFAQEYDSDLAFFNQHWFDYVNFTDERVIRSGHLADKITIYFSSYVDRRVDIGYKNGVKMLIDKAGSNGSVKQYLANYLIDVFDRNGPNGMPEWIIENFLASCGGPTANTLAVIRKKNQLMSGQRVPDIVLQTPTGQPISLYNALGSPVTMVYFWGSWCSHCKEENPKVVALTNQYRNKGLQVFAVGVENNLEEWRTAVKAMNTPWIHVADDKSFASPSAYQFDVKTTPTIYLLNSNGEVLAKNLNTEQLSQALAQLLP
jgi:thiol-disulfide isomerase/thioredoxin